MTNLAPNIIFRLVLSKTILRDALHRIEENNNEFDFSQGLIALHDAVDNFIGTIANHLTVAPPSDQKGYLMNIIQLVEQKQKDHEPNFSFFCKSEINQLNIIRNNIKHHGIIPNVTNAKNLVQPIVDSIYFYCQKYFNIELDSVGLSSLIKDLNIQDEVQKVEKLIETENIKEALNAMAIIKFKVFDESPLLTRLTGRYDVMFPPDENTLKLRLSINIFPEKSFHDDQYHRLKLLEKGIDYKQLEIFEDLTARVGINNAKDWQCILQHNTDWAAPNWNKQNAYFCLNTLVDAILKNQKKHDGFKKRMVWTLYTIRAIEPINIKNRHGEKIYTLEKDEIRQATISGYIDGVWETYGVDSLLISLHKNSEKENVTGYFAEDDRKRIEFLICDQFIHGKNGDLIPLSEAAK